ncbi:MAG: HPr family phosphocarrier protein [Spirochaetia bacterium]|nr:HPr family phosphocarrier protein [Spirochaetia bacterium]
MMNGQIKDDLISFLGGCNNIESVTNCMTRVRVTVVDEKQVNESKIKVTDTVLGLVHDRKCNYEIIVGPGKSREYADELKKFCSGKDSSAVRKKKITVSSFCKTIGDIFIPLIPGTIAAGLCGGLAGMLKMLIPDYGSQPGWYAAFLILTLIQSSFLAYITAWTGYRAAEKFGATPILGGMLGMITSLPAINDLAMLIGLYNEASPLNSVLIAGRGGILAVIFGVFFMAKLERSVDSHLPDALRVVFTPLLTLLIFVMPYVFIVMPAMGYLSSAICEGLGFVCMSSNAFIRIIAGYIAAALFLPLVSAGLHHGLVGLYAMQLELVGYVTLYPVLCMAGAGQIGAAILIRKKAKKIGNHKMVSIIDGALIPGILGIGEPLIYGVTLPLGKPFITAGLGAGFGGAFVMLMKSAAVAWGTSGILGTFMMIAGPNSPVMSMIFYLIGFVISIIMGFLITAAVIKPEDLMPEIDSDNRIHVCHGDPILTFCDSDADSDSFVYVIKDPVGIHARPAGALVKLARNYRSEISFSAGGKTAKADSIISIMSLGVVQGTELKVEAHGDDSQAALSALRKYFSDNL